MTGSQFTHSAAAAALALILTGLLLAGCGSAGSAIRLVVSAEAATPPPADTPTPSPAAATPTQTPQPATATVTQSPSPEPTFTPTLTPLPQTSPVTMPPLLQENLPYISLSTAGDLKQIWRFEAGAGPFAFSPDSRRLAVAAGDSVQVWDLQSGQNTLALYAPGGWYNRRAAFDPTSPAVAAIEHPNHVRVWDDAGNLIQSIEAAGTDTLHQLLYSQNGKRLIALGERGGEPVVIFWNVETGQQVAESSASPYIEDELLISPNGLLLIQAGREGILRFWDPMTGCRLAEQYIYACPDALTGAAFAPGGQMLATQCSGTLSIFLEQLVWFRPGDRRLLTRLEIEPLSEGQMSFNRDAAVLAVVSLPPERVLLLNLFTHKPQAVIEGFSAEIVQTAFSPTGKLFGIRLADGSLEVWGILSS